MDQKIVLDPVQSDEGLIINCLQDYRCGDVQLTRSLSCSSITVMFHASAAAFTVLALVPSPCWFALRSC